MGLGQDEIRWNMRLVVLPLFKEGNATELMSVVCFERCVGVKDSSYGRIYPCVPDFILIFQKAP